MKKKLKKIGNMLNNIERQESILWHRQQCLECMAIALRRYRETKNEEFYTYAKWFGYQSKELKIDLEKL